MTTEEITDAEIVDEPSTSLERVAPTAPTSLFRTDDPVEVVAKATHIADALKAVVVAQKLATNIQGRDHLRVEAWQTLGSMLGVFPVKEWVRAVPWPDPIPAKLTAAHAKGLTFGYEASFLAQTAAGAIVGGGEGACMRTEGTWASRDDYALKSMSQTRATSRALKAPLGFVVALAGYETTPAEEMSAGRRSSRVNVRPGRAAIADTYVEDFESEADGLASQLLLLASDKDRALQAIHAKRGELAPGLFLDWLGAEIAKRTVAA
jgi:hypothetical protein